MKTKPKPLRFKDTYLAEPLLVKCYQALQAVVDAFGDSDSLLAKQCKDALKSIQAK